MKVGTIYKICGGGEGEPYWSHAVYRDGKSIGAIASGENCLVISHTTKNDDGRIRKETVVLLSHFGIGKIERIFDVTGINRYIPKSNGFTKVFVGRFGKIAYCNLWDVSYEILCTGKE